MERSCCGPRLKWHLSARRSLAGLSRFFSFFEKVCLGKIEKNPDENRWVFAVASKIFLDFSRTEHEKKKKKKSGKRELLI